MKKIFIIIICFAISLQINATNLRGRVVHSIAGNTQPATGVRVDLLVWDNTKWVDVAFAITDNNGYYYFLNYENNKKIFISIAGVYYPQQPLKISGIEPPLYQDIPTIIN